MQLSIVVPVYNEQETLADRLTKLDEYIKDKIKSYEIIIADNGSVDNTKQIGMSLSKKNSKIKYFFVPTKGRGIALRQVWLQSKSAFLCYMDLDLSTDLVYLPILIESVKNGSDIAIGSRLLKESQTTRSNKRTILSKGYNFLVRLFFSTKIHDFQCGFKAIRKDAFIKLEPLIKDNKFFFDTELLLIAEHFHYKIAEIPVTWIEYKQTKVKILSTIVDYIFDLFRLKVRLLFQKPSI